MSRDADYYGLLGVPKDASEVEIRERFRALAREVHPDRAPASKKAAAEAKFQMLTEAVNVLTNPERRAAYDFDLAAAAGGADGDPVAQNYVAQ
jgi:DnaJ-class molecular chaperone